MRSGLLFVSSFAATDAEPNLRVAVGRLGPLGYPIDGAGLHLMVWKEGEQWKPQKLYAAVVTPGAELSAATTKLLASDAADSGDVSAVWTGASYTIVYHRLGTNSEEFAVSMQRATRSTRRRSQSAAMVMATTIHASHGTAASICS